MKKRNDDVDNFYYTAGVAAGNLYPRAPIEFKRIFIDAFKSYVESRGGPTAFASSREAVQEFGNQYFSKGKKDAR